MKEFRYRVYWAFIASGIGICMIELGVNYWFSIISTISIIFLSPNDEV